MHAVIRYVSFLVRHSSVPNSDVLYFSIIRRSLTNAWCKPTVYEINAEALINAEGVAKYPRSNNCTCFGDKEKSIRCIVITKVQVIEVAGKTSKEAVAMSAENSRLTVWQRTRRTCRSSAE